MLLAFDLDKTIVTDDQILPRPIEHAIRRARDAGHLVCVLTGRPHRSAAPYLEQLGVTGHYSVNHGALVVGAGGAVLRHRRLAIGDVRALLSPHVASGGLEFSCVVDDILYVKNPDDERWAWVHTANRELRRFDPSLELLADKVVFSTLGDCGALERQVLESHPHVVTYLWGDGFLEVTANDADKGGALAMLAEGLGVPRAQTVAFGDGLNDVTMLTWAGRAVAVGPDAHPRVLAAADEHIPSPEEGGVAAWLDINL